MSNRKPTLEDQRLDMFRARLSGLQPLEGSLLSAMQHAYDQWRELNGQDDTALLYLAFRAGYLAGRGDGR